MHQQTTSKQLTDSTDLVRASWLRFSTSACSSAAGRVGAGGASAASAGAPAPRAYRAGRVVGRRVKLGPAPAAGGGREPNGRKRPTARPPRAPAPAHPLTQDAETAVSATATLLAMLGSSGEAWQRTSGRLELGLAPRRELGRAFSTDGACADALMLFPRARCQLRGARRLGRRMVRLQLCPAAAVCAAAVAWAPVLLLPTVLFD